MKILIIKQPSGKIVKCLLLKHKASSEYSFINLTKGHICPCAFGSYEEALQDIPKQGAELIGVVENTDL